MRSVGLKVLKNKLSEYVRMAAGGETVLVTDRDRVVAELGPPRADRKTMTAQAQWDEMVRKGLITPAKSRTGKPPPRKPIMSFEQLMRELAQDREDR